MSFSVPDVMSNPRAERVRDVARLATRAGRAKRGLFLAEGPQAVREALALHRERLAASGAPVVESVYATADFLERSPELAELAEVAAGTRLRVATEEVLAAMADTVSPQGILAVCHLPATTLEEVLAGRPRLVAVMCRVQDPGNAGTILRAADAAGADAVVLTEGSVDIYNPKAVRSTAGSIFHLPIVSGVPFGDLSAALRGAGLAVLAADGYGDTDLDALQDASAARRLAGAGSGTDPQAVPDPAAGVVLLEAPSAWLFGNEAQGLDREELAAADCRVAVPLYGVAESLNVGTAATVCLYASARAQRRA
ncbi:RNA methyltransferase [Zafaria cholistanensis]|uniref:RNA methyltransferase n=1 Tax=Zafaria cholistanensis TaxID=1682741 RepID=A0A5A7NTM6_9MICC|nr:RNA methyltransferase [Zafaria cholistanensis]GER24215.1 RNA methyltransferase [Zafaria cholistanensis]